MTQIESAVLLVTEPAAAKVLALIEDEPDAEELRLRVAVKPGGCSGFSYDMYFDSELAEGDRVTDAFGVRVVVDPQSAPLLQGATLDFEDGLQGKGFHIDNPNASSSCGCGSSFS